MPPRWDSPDGALLQQKMQSMMSGLAMGAGDAGSLDQEALLAAFQQMAGNRTPRERVKDMMEKQRTFAFTNSGTSDPEDRGRFDTIRHCIEGYVLDFLKRHGPAPAIDVGAGSAVYSVAIAERFEELEMWSTDIVDEESVAAGHFIGMHQTREAMNIMVEEEAAARKPLFDDEQGVTIRAQDRVVLNGLQRAEFNGRKGVALACTDNGRVGVKLDGGGEAAFKPQNVSLHESTGHDSEDKMFDKWRSLVPSMLERVREVDVTRKDTWANVKHLDGKCALLTCTCLLTQVGYRAPLMWQDVLLLASRMLAVDGICYLYDSDKYGDYGNLEAMTDFVGSKNLMLSFQLRWLPFLKDPDDIDGEMIAMVFVKGGKRNRHACSEYSEKTSTAIAKAFDTLTSRAVDDGLMRTATLDKVKDHLAGCSAFESSCYMVRFLDAVLIPGARVVMAFEEKEGAEEYEGKRAIITHNQSGWEGLKEELSTAYSVNFGSQKREGETGRFSRMEGAPCVIVDAAMLRLIDMVEVDFASL